MSNSNLDQLMKRYETIDNHVAEAARTSERAKLQVEMKKEELKERMAALQAQGISFTSLSTLRAEAEKLEVTLNDNLTAMERKIKEAN